MPPTQYKRLRGVPITDRIKRSVEINDSGCWIWQLSKDRYGYGRFVLRSNGRTTKPVAHRVAYEAFIGAVPEGLELDHLCRVTSCVNPARLEPVTPLVNARRRWSVALKDACMKGHKFDEANTRVRASGRRDCLACRRDQNRNRPSRAREQVSR
jgi:hypothetical protein